MVDVALSVTRLLVALFLVLLNGFFVASEFAFVRVRATAVERLVEEGRRGSATLQEVMDSLDDYLATTQLGITIASLGLGWVGEPAVASLIEPVVSPLLPADAVHLVAFALGFGFITFLHVVFGELAPKTVAIAEAERLSLFVAPPMKFFYLLFYPGLVVFNGTANGFTSLFGVPPASETEETLEEREIRRVLARSGEEGHVDTVEVDMIESVFELDDIVVREVMVPLPDVVSVPADASLAELTKTVLDEGHTRYPVVASDDPNDVVGFVDAKDILRATAKLDEDTTAEGSNTTAEDIARGIVVVPETTTVNDLLLRFREEHQQMAGIVDEWGSFEGIATVEDTVEAVVGDLRDGFDVDEREPGVRETEDGYEVDGGVSLSAVNDQLGARFESEGFETVGGYVLDRLSRVPEVGDTVETPGHVVEVTCVDGARVSEVVVRGKEGSDG
ncbi:hemolysin family protein [Haladaptatus sp. F3-133]|uniref:Hemolysin family protein n=1 Tax=Halorutilus salinus TaxID=2487751 RepID=A0A9Q4C580_9EURY|nr:hemolysin family protein [Halorutilus salinus]MCX2818649.1 hemolysin family protein [Halorutilus salinus]